jgi:hypothetical protein
LGLRQVVLATRRRGLVLAVNTEDLARAEFASG